MITKKINYAGDRVVTPLSVSVYMESVNPPFSAWTEAASLSPAPAVSENLRVQAECDNLSL